MPQEIAPNPIFANQAAEQLTYGDTVVPIYRLSAPDLFIALQPPGADPYVVAPYDLHPQVIVQFVQERLPRIAELQEDMRKRFSKTASPRCRYQTGDIAHIMGRPFQLRVYPLNNKVKKIKAGARGTVTSKYSVSADISLLTLYVMHPKNYDDAKRVFDSYAETVIMNNASGMVRDFTRILGSESKPPAVRMRSMRDKFTSSEAGALWLSTELVPYPPECLMYAIWAELVRMLGIPEVLANDKLAEVLPNWQDVRQLLAARPEPYCLQ